MSKPRAIIIGASGLLGSYLYKYGFSGYDQIGTFQKYPLDNLVHLDITQRVEVESLIRDFNPDLIFLPAAFTNVDLCEEKKELCFRINVEGVQNVVDAIKDTKTKLVYFSSDYIFNGHGGPYIESDIPDPLSVYGKSKLEGEKVILKNTNNFLIIRTTGIYGWEPQQKNFVVNLIKKNSEKINVYVPIDQVTTPTYAGDLAEVVWKIVKMNKNGIYNVVGSDLLSRLEFANLAAEVFGLEKKFIIGVNTEAMGKKAVRPLNGGLTISKIREDLNLDTLGARDGLLSMKKEKWQ